MAQLPDRSGHNPLSSTAKIRISISPTQKPGMDWRKSDAMRLAWSAARSLRVAETMPSGIASTVESTMAAAASSTVAGQKCWKTMTMAGRRSRMDVPKSPRGTAARKSRYWTSHGRSSPSCRCTAATSSRVAAWSTRNAAIAGQADEEEHDGHDAPHHDDGVDEAPQEELPHRLRYFRKPTGRKSMCSSDSAWKPTTRGLSA